MERLTSVIDQQNKLIRGGFINQTPKLWRHRDMRNTPSFLCSNPETLHAFEAFKVASRKTNKIAWSQPGLTCKCQHPLHPPRCGVLQSPLVRIAPNDLGSIHRVDAMQPVTVVRRNLALIPRPIEDAHRDGARIVVLLWRILPLCPPLVQLATRLRVLPKLRRVVSELVCKSQSPLTVVSWCARALGSMFGAMFLLLGEMSSAERKPYP